MNDKSHFVNAIGVYENHNLGSTHTRRVDVRIVAATNRDLATLVRGKSFRMDLYCRLNVFPIALPPLRNRLEDIPLLVADFVRKYSTRMSKRITHVSNEAIDTLMRYPWRGNIRELQNVIERTVVLCDGEMLSIDESSLHRETLRPLQTPVALTEALVSTEKEMIEAALEESRGRVSGPSGAAVKLRIPRTTLESKIRSLQIDKNIFRSERYVPSTGDVAPLR
jgi:formate hydrogenlyase transcriptional activator